MAKFSPLPGEQTAAGRFELTVRLAPRMRARNNKAGEGGKTLIFRSRTDG
jgi:hypothetical protein